MRTLVPLIAVSLLVGCAAQPTAPPRPAAVVRPVAPTSETGLAFDPPIAGRVPAPNLSRAAREPAAVSGVDATSTSTFDVTTSIRDADDDGGYEQESVTQTTGTVHH